MLNNFLPKLQDKIRHWAEHAETQGWIDQNSLQQLTRFDDKFAGDLFINEERPLVVGFFGGTGVGKSSLLNRLAGENIARTGVERPTSREVTIYVHEQVSISDLPKELPTDEVVIKQHRNRLNHDILWVDMPDFDSAELHHREIVLSWLPYIDVLVYAVSPERYKDDSGWRLLLEHGERHAWLFVINHWDRGNEIQKKDFHDLLASAGLANPIILCTDSNPHGSAAVDDDFETLQKTMLELSSDNIIKHLEDRGITLRAQQLQQRLQTASQSLGNKHHFIGLRDDWRQLWRSSANDINQDLQWKISSLSQRFAVAEASWIRTLIDAVKGNKNNQDAQPEANEHALVQATELWDDQLQTRVSLALDQFVQQAITLDLPGKAFALELNQIKQEAKDIFSTQVQTQLNLALGEPGTRWQRQLHKVLTWLGGLLPGLALLWIAWEVVAGFVVGTSDGGNYLGINFTIHSLLLVALAWITPYYIMQKTRPSLQKAAEQGMQRGCQSALEHINQRVLEQLKTVKNKQQALLHEAQQIFADDILPGFLSDSEKNKILTRMLVTTDR